MNDFYSLGLSQPTLDAIAKLQFSEPTPIQADSIPLALKGHDILGSAQTGTGKTVAFGIPLVEHLLNTDGTALVLVPTRELAMQVVKTLESLLPASLSKKTALLIGGADMFRQLRTLQRKPRLVVGTPGRVNDHLRRGSLNLTKTNFLVLDETDRMLDMGFTVQIEEILPHLPEKRQTLLFSATVPKNIMKVAKQYLNNPERISIGDGFVPVDKINQEIVFVKQQEKYDRLLEQIENRQGSIIIFVKTKANADKMALKLQNLDHSAAALHGDLRHNQRARVIQKFRDYKCRILVATDVAARGLDIPHIEHVINYDLPQCPEDYIHRIGRTARAGSFGEALCFIAPYDRAQWRVIERLMDPSTKDKDVGGGHMPSRAQKRANRGRPSRSSSSRSEKPRFQDSKSRQDRGFKDKEFKRGGRNKDDQNDRHTSNRKKRKAPKGGEDFGRHFDDYAPQRKSQNKGFDKPYKSRRRDDSSVDRDFKRDYEGERKRGFDRKKSFGDKRKFDDNSSSRRSGKKPGFAIAGSNKKKAIAKKPGAKKRFASEGKKKAFDGYKKGFKKSA